MIWIILNLVFIGIYIYTKKNSEMKERLNKTLKTINEMSRRILDKIPKEKDE